MQSYVFVKGRYRDFAFKPSTPATIEWAELLMEALAERAVNRAADYIQERMRTDNPTGRQHTYVDDLGGRHTYTASAPGEYPTVKTGLLASSVRVIQAGKGWAVYTNVAYGRRLEQGYTHPTAGRIIRPWLSRAFHELEGEFKEMLRDGKNYTRTFNIGGYNIEPTDGGAPDEATYNLPEFKT